MKGKVMGQITKNLHKYIISFMCTILTQGNQI